RHIPGEFHSRATRTTTVCWIPRRSLYSRLGGPGPSPARREPGPTPRRSSRRCRPSPSRTSPGSEPPCPWEASGGPAGRSPRRAAPSRPPTRCTRRSRGPCRCGSSSPVAGERRPRRGGAPTATPAGGCCGSTAPGSRRPGRTASALRAAERAGRRRRESRPCADVTRRSLREELLREVELGTHHLEGDLRPVALAREHARQPSGLDRRIEALDRSHLALDEAVGRLSLSLGVEFLEYGVDDLASHALADQLHPQHGPRQARRPRSGLDPGAGEALVIDESLSLELIDDPFRDLGRKP